MTGRITRLIDDQQVGTIAAEDGHNYVFNGMALNEGTFRDLSLGACVTFEPIKGQNGVLRAGALRSTTK